MMSTTIYKLHMKSWHVRLILDILFIVLLMPAIAMAKDEPLPNAALENRAQNLFTQVRCMVCQGEVIKESNADLAVAMRALIREQIASGMHDDEIIAYLVERYGMQVVTKPAFNHYTAMLWLLPWAFLLWGLYRIFRQLRITYE